MRKKEPLSKKFNADLKKQTKKRKKLFKRPNARQKWPKLNYKKLIKLRENNFKKNKDFWSKNSKKVRIKLLNSKSINKRKKKRFKWLVWMMKKQKQTSRKLKPKKRKSNKNLLKFKTKRLNFNKKLKSKKLLWNKNHKSKMQKWISSFKNKNNKWKPKRRNFNFKLN